MRRGGRAGGRALRRRATVAASLAVGLALLAACSLALDHATAQCESAADCVALGEAFSGSACSADKVCVRSSGPGDGGPGGDAACTTNARCISAADGAPSVCDRAGGACVALLSQDCERVVGPIADDDVILFGTLNPIKGANQSSGVTRQNAEELALSEFAQTVVGLPGGTGARPRPLAFVSCDDSEDPLRAARHLVEAVKVPAILGAGNSGTTISVAQSVAIPRGVLMIAPSATSPSITSLADDGLLWRTAPSDALQSIPLKAQIGELEPALKAAHGLAKVKLAILFKNDAYGLGLSGGVLSGLTLNGEPVAAAGNAGFFLQQQFDAAADLTATVASLKTFAPNIVLLMGTTEAVTKLLAPLEAAWPTGAAAPPRPTYVLSDGCKKAELLAACAASPGLCARARGTAPGRMNALAEGFALRYEARFGGSSSSFGTSGAYDATYLLAYSIVAVGQAPITGAAIAGGMRKMVGGVRIAVGPADINPAFQALRAGRPIDFDGASGPLDFDVATGEAPSDIDVWCIAKDAQGAPVFASSGRYYRAATNEIVGTFACP